MNPYFEAAFQWSMRRIDFEKAYYLTKSCFKQTEPEEI